MFIWSRKKHVFMLALITAALVCVASVIMRSVSEPPLSSDSATFNLAGK